jgi:hypothetical protein
MPAPQNVVSPLGSKSVITVKWDGTNKPVPRHFCARAVPPTNKVSTKFSISGESDSLKGTTTLIHDQRPFQIWIGQYGGSFNISGLVRPVGVVVSGGPKSN